MKTTVVEQVAKLLKKYFFNNLIYKHNSNCECEKCQEKSFLEYQQYYQQTTRWQTV